MKKIFFAGLAIFCLHSLSFAKGGGTSAGLVLLRNSGARASALGEAFVSMKNDVTAMEFNPASLATLESGDASLQYERGAFDDAFSKAMVGFQTPTIGAFGLSLGYYNSGKASLFDGVSQRSVTAEQDRVATLGYAFQKKSTQFGADIKYLSSDLAESNSGTAMAADIGVQSQLTSHLRFGVSGPLVQTKLNYANTNEKLPKLYRAGVGFASNLPLATGNLPVQFLFDVPYDANAHTTGVALGAETYLGIMALRVGFNTQSDVQQFSIGTGFRFQRMSLDYSFGMTNDGNIQSVNKITFSIRFNDFKTNANAPTLSKKENNIQNGVLAVGTQSGPKVDVDKSQLGTYQVRDGETLESIALKRYGSIENWTDIYAVNREAYSSPEKIKAGSWIFLPKEK